jgi:hypothetical protein
MTNPIEHHPSLQEWLDQQQDDKFPPAGGVKYKDRLRSVGGYLDENVHPHVEKGALMNKDGLLTAHGPEHVRTVARRAADLLRCSDDAFPQLSPYEVYLLLMAIHFHDVGNLYGRKGHEQKLASVMAEVGKLAGDEMVERQVIQKIAGAHGGELNGDKDTISKLAPSQAVLGQDIRTQLLAAILRFADELADDSRRAARVLLELRIIPQKSEVYHAYAQALHSVIVRARQHVVDLRYSFVKADAIKKFGKGQRKVFLLDEIYARTLKTCVERRYCTRFMQGVVRIDEINVHIEIYQDTHSTTPCVDPIGYRLEARGYPGIDGDIRVVCPEVKMNGKSLCHLLS